MSADARAAAVPRGGGRGVMVARLLLLGVGVVLAAVGGWKLVQSGLSNIVATLEWLAGGVIAHDAILAPLTVVLVVVSVRFVPWWLRAPATVGLVVLGSVTVAAVPVLGRFGAIPDNPTLLDRNYVAGWLVFAAIVVLAVAVAGWARRRSVSSQAPQGASRRPPG